VFLFLSLASQAGASLKLEQKYPTLNKQTLTGETSLAPLIKYIVSFFILVSVIISSLSLITGGVQYLSSSGNPRAMDLAKKRIINAFLGLTILASSYFILKILNPQLLVLKTQVVPVENSVVFLTEKGFSGEGGLKNGNDIEPIVLKGEGAYIVYSIKNLENLFGSLTLSNPSSVQVNFENLPIKYIGFIGENAQDIKIIAYSEPNFKGEKNEYSSVGREAGVSSALPIFRQRKISVVELNFFKSEVDFINFKREKTKGEILHPPLSVKIKIEKPGIYLYGEGSVLEREERFFQENVADLSVYDFNDKAEKIRIKNEPGDNDYLVVLYDDANFSGSLRIFFQEKARKGQVAGNIGLSEEAVNKTDIYGKVNGVSSLQIFSLNPEGETCKKVKICSGPGFSGECKTYNVVDRTLPIYKPQNLPEEFNDQIRSLYIDGKCLVVLFENKTKNDEEGSWENWKDSPGPRSEVFTKSVSDLTKDPYQIGRCPSVAGLSFIAPKPCASAIAIYPLK